MLLQILTSITLGASLLLMAGCSGSSDMTNAKKSQHPPKLANVASPTDMVLDRRGNLYVSEMITGRIYCVNPDGTSTLFARGLDAPTGLCLDRDDNLLVAETGKGRIIRITKDGRQHVVSGE